jgi:hypothetical protein
MLHDLPISASSCLKHVSCYCSHGVLYVGFQPLEVVDLNLVDCVLHKTPQEKIQWVQSGDLRGQVNSPLLPIHLSVQVIPNMAAEMWRRPVLLEDSLRW